MSKKILTSKKLLCVLAAAFTTLSGAFAAGNQLRDYVGIVKQTNSDETVEKLKKAGDEIRTKGFSRYADFINNYVENGTFGSGFVYVAPDGTNYVITNRHVVNHDSASIEFEDAATGKIQKYENLVLFAVDDDIDVAILKFADNQKPFTKGLRFSNVKPADGTEVYSAGFPGLGDKPLWQLGKGIITNSYARIPELLDPAISTIIQHSAEVDAGNSGGPLLVKNANSITGYDVIGINTWKAAFRQNANYSIPISVINKFLTTRQSASIDKQKSAKQQIEKFIEEIAKEEINIDKIASIISKKAALDSGCSDFIAAAKYAPTKSRDAILGAFSRSPIEGFRYAIAYSLISEYNTNGENSPKLTLTEVYEKDSKVFANLTFGEEKRIASFTLENGICHIDGIKKEASDSDSNTDSKKSNSTKKASKSNVSSTDFDPPTLVNIDICGSRLSIDSTNTFGFAASVDIWMNYFSFGTGIKVFKKEYDKLITFGCNTGLRLPITFNNAINISAFGKAGIGIARFTENTGFYFSAEGGVEIIYIKTDFVKPGIGISFDHYTASYTDVHSYNNSRIKKDFNTLNFYVLFAF